MLHQPGLGRCSTHRLQTTSPVTHAHPTVMTPCALNEPRVPKCFPCSHCTFTSLPFDANCWLPTCWSASSCRPSLEVSTVAYVCLRTDVVPLQMPTRRDTALHGRLWQVYSREGVRAGPVLTRAEVQVVLGGQRLGCMFHGKHSLGLTPTAEQRAELQLLLSCNRSCPSTSSCACACAAAV